MFTQSSDKASEIKWGMKCQLNYEMSKETKIYLNLCGIWVVSFFYW